MSDENARYRSPIGRLVSELSLLFRYIASGFVAFLVAAFVGRPAPGGLTVLDAAYDRSHGQWVVVGVFAAIIGMLVYAIGSSVLLPYVEQMLQNKLRPEWKGKRDEWLDYLVRRWARRHADRSDPCWRVHAGFQEECDKWANMLHFLYASCFVAILTPLVVWLSGFELDWLATVMVLAAAVLILCGCIHGSSQRHLQIQLDFNGRYPEPVRDGESEKVPTRADA